MTDERVERVAKAMFALEWRQTAEELPDVWASDGDYWLAHARVALDSMLPLQEGVEERAREAEEVLRGLASYVSAGGYNTEAVDPAVFDDKIRWGIEHFVNGTIQRCADIIEEQSKSHPRATWGSVKRAILDLKSDGSVAALPSTAREDDWQPIETAPKDGTQILAWRVHPHAEFSPERDEYQSAVVTHWIDHNGGGWTWYGLTGRFTHWKPLPDPPAIRALKGKPTPEGEGGEG